MLRPSILLSTSLLLAAAAQAQCPQGSPVGLLNWSSTAGYGATLAFSDESISSPPIALTAFPNFPMPGAVGNLNQLWVNSNGEVYLTDSTLALTQPADGALYGVNTLPEFQGIAGASARVVPLGGDHMGSVVAGAHWSINIDQSVAGEVRISWIDMSRFSYSTTDRFSFACTLYSTGAMQFDYGTTFPVGLTGRWIGVSVGNAEPSTGGSQVLTTLPTSPATEGILYETVANFDTYVGQSVLIAPNFTAGVENYTVAAVFPYVPPTACSSNVAYGTGCHSYMGPDPASSLAELYVGSPAAKTALDGNAMLYTRVGNGYSAQWIPGAAPALYVPPTGGATSLSLTDDSTTTVTPSTAVPIPGGLAPVWTISSNGILTAGTTGNNGTSTGGGLAQVGTGPGLGWYCWRDFNPAAAGSGAVKKEEAGNMLYLTFDGVYEYSTTNPATFQWQINMTTGDVMMVWSSMAVSSNTTNVVVGCSLVGVGPTPASTALSSANPFLLVPPSNLTPMTLGAAPSPRINPSTVVTYTASNLPEFVPGSGVYLSTCFLSVNPNPAGFDLANILTSVPGCNAWILSLDVDLGAQVTLAPTASWNLTYSNVYFAPGNVVAAQAVALFDGSTPLVNGESGGILLSNGVLSTTQLD